MARLAVRQPMTGAGRDLSAGALMAEGEERSARLATLSAVESTWDPLPIDAEVARQFARIAAALRAGGRRVPILDALVAATAIVEQIPVVTQDNDYEAIPGVEVIRV